jgi:hypothetical protein
LGNFTLESREAGQENVALLFLGLDGGIEDVGEKPECEASGFCYVLWLGTI